MRGGSSRCAAYQKPQDLAALARWRALGLKPLGSRVFAMYLILSKKPRKTNRTKSKRYRAKLKAKDRGRRSRIYRT